MSCLIRKKGGFESVFWKKSVLMKGFSKICSQRRHATWPGFSLYLLSSLNVLPNRALPCLPPFAFRLILDQRAPLLACAEKPCSRRGRVKDTSNKACPRLRDPSSHLHRTAQQSLCILDMSVVQKRLCDSRVLSLSDFRYLDLPRGPEDIKSAPFFSLNQIDTVES